jgi:hypothetical protein
LILPILVLYAEDNPTRRNRIAMTILMIVASLSQIEICVLIMLTSILLEASQYVIGRRTNKGRLQNLVILALSIIPALAIAFSYGSRFATVAIEYPVELGPPHLSTMLQSFGGPFLPVTIIGIILALGNIRRVHSSHGLFLSMFTVTIVFFVTIPAFILSNPPLFRLMAGRASSILPAPLLAADGARWFYVWGRNEYQKGSSTDYWTPLLGCAIVWMIAIAGLGLPGEASRHHQPFISEQYLNEIQDLASNRNSSKTMILVTRMAPVEVYKNYGWAGSILGRSLGINCLLPFAIAGIPQPSVDQSAVTLAASQINHLKELGISFPLFDSDIEIGIPTSMYGHFTDDSANPTSLDSGAFLISGSSCEQYLLNYTVPSSSYYDFTDDWRFYPGEQGYARFQKEQLFGNESITYALLSVRAGNYTVSVVYRNSDVSFGGFMISMNSTIIQNLTYWSALDYRTLEITVTLPEQSMIFVAIHPFSSGHSDVIVRSIRLSYDENCVLCELICGILFANAFR